MSDEPETEVEDDGLPEEPLHGPDGSLDCINGRYDFIAFWLEKLGVSDPRGAAVTFGEGCSLAILHPITGEWLTPEQIVKKAGNATVRRIQ
jgi:hypothetical protein